MPDRDGSPAFTRTRDAWERFAAGDEVPADVPLSIALSWLRCRDRHRLDPLAPVQAPVRDDVVYRREHASVFTMLGAVAAGIAGRHDGCVAAVTDGDGRVLASWAARGSGECAPAPGSVWAEARPGPTVPGRRSPTRGRSVCGGRSTGARRCTTTAVSRRRCATRCSARRWRR